MTKKETKPLAKAVSQEKSDIQKGLLEQHATKSKEVSFEQRKKLNEELADG